VFFFPLQLRRRDGVPTQMGISNLLGNAEQDGDNDGGLEGLPEHDEENWNGEHVRHGYFGTLQGKTGMSGGGGAKARREEARRGQGKTARRSHSITSLALWLTGPGPYQIKKPSDDKETPIYKALNRY